MADQEPKKSAVDSAADGTGGASNGFGAFNGFRQMYDNLTHTGMLGLPDKALELNDLARPFGLNYDPPPAPGLQPAMAGTPEEAAEAAMTAPLGESAAPALEATEEYTAAETAAAGPMGANNILGGVGGGLGLVAGTMQAISGIDRMTKADAKEQDEVHGGLDVLGGTAGIVGGGLALGSALGAGGAIAAAAPVAAPIAAAIGLGVAGDHRAEEMDLWGHDADGKPQGSVEAAWNESQHLGDVANNALGGGTLGLIGGAATAGVSTAVLETGAAVADVGLGIDGLGASSGMFGTATNADGKTYNMGAFQALDHAGHAAGDGVDDLIGLNHDSLAGEIVGGGVRGLVDGAGAGLALAGDAVGGLVGGAEALGGWVSDLF